MAHNLRCHACRILKGIMGLSRWVILGVTSYKSPRWSYPRCSLLITLLTKSHEPLGIPKMGVHSKATS